MSFCYEISTDVFRTERELCPWSFRGEKSVPEGHHDNRPVF